MADWVDAYYADWRRAEAWRKASEARVDAINEEMECTGSRNPQIIAAILALREEANKRTDEQ